MEKLPPEIALEIFYRLSPESVGRCKLVCKSWHNLLLPCGCGDDGNCFANMNLHRRQHHQRNLDDYSTLNFIALLKEAESTVVEFHNAEYDEEVEEGLLNCKVKRLVFSQIYISGCRQGLAVLVESCNGLLCLVIAYRRGMTNDSLKDRIVVCNPLLHEYVTLPLSDQQYSKCGMVITGFGHNPITDEYKVVVVYYRLYSFYIGDVEVYTLGKSSNGGAGMWRSIGTIKYKLLSGLRSVLMNGSIHWLANIESEQNIVSLNLDDEEFRVMPLPIDLNITTMLIDQLKELKGCLCLIARTSGTWPIPCDQNRNFDIWLLKDYMNKESWVKAFSIKWVEGETLYLPVAIKKKKKKDGDGDAILCWRSSKSTKGLVSYDPKTEKFEEVGRRPVVDERLIFDSVLHINSLVSLKALGEDVEYAED